MAKLALPAGLGILILVALGLTIAHDPAPGVTWSGAPYTDEGWNVLNARNLAILGTWSTDEWNRQTVTLPYSLVVASVFEFLGVGIIQARLVSVTAIAATTAVLALVGNRVAGPVAAILAGTAFATSATTLYYGRLAFIEPFETLLLSVGLLTLIGNRDRQWLWGAIAGLCLAMAIGSKPIALFPAIGLLGAVAITAVRDPSARRWLLAATAVIAAAGLSWMGLVWLPSQGAVAGMTSVWLGYLPGDPAQALAFARAYLVRSDDVLRMIGPILVGATIGTTVLAFAWRRLDQRNRLIALASIGWLLGGSVILFVVSYNPNRYLLPLAPPLGVLAALGAAVVGRAIGRRWARRGPSLVCVGAIGLAVTVAAPGVLRWVGWLSETGSTLPATQARIQAIIPSSEVVGGDLAPLMAMRHDGVVILSAFGLNQGDLYSERNLRWVLLQSGEVPRWASAHPDIWAARRLVLTTMWGPNLVSLYQLPHEDPSG